MADVSELDAAIERSRFPDGTYPMTLEGLQIHIDTAKRLADVAVNISNDMDDLEDPDDHDGRIPLAASDRGGDPGACGGDAATCRHSRYHLARASRAAPDVGRLRRHPK
jgi:hypothetical protein